MKIYHIEKMKTVKRKIMIETNTWAMTANPCISIEYL